MGPFFLQPVIKSTENKNAMAKATAPRVANAGFILVCKRNWSLGVMRMNDERFNKLLNPEKIFFRDEKRVENGYRQSVALVLFRDTQTRQQFFLMGAADGYFDSFYTHFCRKDAIYHFGVHRKAAMHANK